MAKKTPKKYRQAKRAARPAAKEAFSGKTKAARRDPMAKYSAEDREVFKEISKESKGRYITDDRGNKIQVKPDETARERIARERQAALRKFREETDTEKQTARDKRMAAKEADVKARNEAAKAARKGKPAPGLLQSAPKEKPLSRPVKKAAAATIKERKRPAKPEAPKQSMVKSLKKPVNVPGTPLSGKMTRAEKSAANKAAWKSMTPAERKNWSANKPTAGKKIVITKADTEKAKAAKASKVETKLTAKGEAVKKRMPGASNRAANALGEKVKTPTYNITTAQPEKASKGAKPAKFIQKKAAVKKAAVKPSTSKAVAIRPKGAVATVAKEGAKKAGKAGFLKGAARLAGKAVTGRVGLAVTAASLLGEPVLRALTKQPAGARKATAPKPIGKDYSVKKEAMAKGRTPAPATTVGAGGSTYTVKKGDTLSGIAKANQTTLAAIREANPEIMKKKKYKQGAMIWSGTKVRIPKK
jgi:LysM repeat protein